MIAGEKSKRTG